MILSGTTFGDGAVAHPASEAMAVSTSATVLKTSNLTLHLTTATETTTAADSIVATATRVSLYFIAHIKYL